MLCNLLPTKRVRCFHMVPAGGEATVIIALYAEGSDGSCNLQYIDPCAAEFRHRLPVPRFAAWWQ